MIVKNKNLKQVFLKFKILLILSFVIYCCLFDISFSNICLSDSIGNADESSSQLDPLDLLINHLPSNSGNLDMPEVHIKLSNFQSDQRITDDNSNMSLDLAVRPDKALPHNSLLISKVPTSLTTQQLWDARISAPQKTKQSQSQKQLRSIMDKIHSIGFDFHHQSPEPVIAVETTYRSEPGDITSDTKFPQEQLHKKKEHKPASDSITSQTLQILGNISADPNTLKNPLQLSEVLFQCGHLKEAGICYQQALRRNNSNDNESSMDKAWILFQIGNCLSKSDPAAAMQKYRQLIVEYPDSPWSQLGKARSKLIDWYLKDKPKALISKYKS